MLPPGSVHATGYEAGPPSCLALVRFGLDSLLFDTRHTERMRLSLLSFSFFLSLSLSLSIIHSLQHGASSLTTQGNIHSARLASFPPVPQFPGEYRRKRSRRRGVSDGPSRIPRHSPPEHAPPSIPKSRTKASHAPQTRVGYPAAVGFSDHSRASGIHPTRSATRSCVTSSRRVSSAPGNLSRALRLPTPFPLQSVRLAALARPRVQENQAFHSGCSD